MCTYITNVDHLAVFRSQFCASIVINTPATVIACSEHQEHVGEGSLIRFYLYMVQSIVCGVFMVSCYTAASRKLRMHEKLVRSMSVTLMKMNRKTDAELNMFSLLPAFCFYL